MILSVRGAVVPYVTRDGSEIRELMHPGVHGNRAQSLAEATIGPGAATLLHRHAITEELYHVTAGEGVMVLPVAYTKGLEFDAVLLLDPTEEKYPENDGQVKLLYVAATRALHELAVLYTGELTGILAKEAPKGRHNQEFAIETLTKAKEYEKV